MCFYSLLLATKTNSSAVVKDCLAESDMHFNLDNEEYLFTIIEKRRKRTTKSESVLCSPTLSLFVCFNLVDIRVLVWSSESTPTCIKTSKRLNAMNKN